MRTRQLLLVLVVAALVSGCAFTHPRYAREDGLPIDWGLEGAISESATVLAFVAPDERYGVYAASD